jgi:Stress responsive A/B Barrel Domain
MTTRKDPVITRVIIVEFRPEASADDIAAFKAGLQELAAESSAVIRMTCGEHFEVSNDAVLSANAPPVAFGNFMSVWEFADEQALNDFLVQPSHKAMAATIFRKVVQRRYVANIR